MPDEREREVLRATHRLFVKERLSTAEVAERLSLMGMHPRHAAQWQYQTVRQAATNPSLWTGETEWGSATTGNYRPFRKVTRMHRDGTPKYGDTVKVPLGNPVFTRQERLALQRTVNRKASVTPSAPQRQMLTGRLFGPCDMDKHYDGVTTKSRPNRTTCARGGGTAPRISRAARARRSRDQRSTSPYGWRSPRCWPTLSVWNGWRASGSNWTTTTT